MAKNNRDKKELEKMALSDEELSEVNAGFFFDAINSIFAAVRKIFSSHKNETVIEDIEPLRGGITRPKRNGGGLESIDQNQD